MGLRADPDLLARATAARQVIRDDPDVDRLYLLSLVIWPTAALVAPPPARRGLTPDEVARMVEFDDGTLAPGDREAPRSPSVNGERGPAPTRRRPVSAAA